MQSQDWNNSGEGSSAGDGSPFSNDERDNVPDPIIDRQSLLVDLQRGSGRYSDADLETIARRLHVALWKKRREIWGVDDVHPLDAARPDVALTALGFRIEGSSSLGQYQDGTTTVDVAGVFDAENRRIQISQRMARHVARFTLAHELGHLVCGAKTGLHRDRALDGDKMSGYAPEEHEADRFAACFLMPTKQVGVEFRYRYLQSRFELNEEIAFAFGFDSSRSFRKQFPTRRDVSLFLAGTKSFNGKQFISMVETFGVSAIAMARRLEDLDIVPKP